MMNIKDEVNAVLDERSKAFHEMKTMLDGVISVAVEDLAGADLPYIEIMPKDRAWNTALRIKCWGEDCYLIEEKKESYWKTHEDLFKKEEGLRYVAKWLIDNGYKSMSNRIEERQKR